jgi:hypothetical protein
MQQIWQLDEILTRHIRGQEPEPWWTQAVIVSASQVAEQLAI